jgi:hypothetical protein
MVRRGGGRIGASKLEGLSIGDREEAQRTSKKRITRIRKIRVPRRTAGDEL